MQSQQPSSNNNMSGLGSGYTLAMPGSGYPEIALFSQFGQLFPQYAELAQLQQQQQKHSMDDGRTVSRGKPRSSDSRSSSAYASRHQAAEQRRRTRINDRLELLRKMVPHAERANTACFLEEVIRYIDSLQRRNTELEKSLESRKSQSGKHQAQQAAPQQQQHVPLQIAVSNPLPPPPQMLPQSTQQHMSAQFHAPFSSEPLMPQHQETSGAGVLPAWRPYHVIAQEQLGTQREGHRTSLSAEPGINTAGNAIPSLLPGQHTTAEALLAASLGVTLPLPAAAMPGLAGLAEAKKNTTESPVSSEESGVPLKKRRMLVL